MTWKVIKTEKEHRQAIKRAMEIFHAQPGSPEDDELGLLLVLIKDYEDRTIKMPQIDILEVIKEKMQERGLRNKDMEEVIGSKGHVSSILSGRRELTLKMAQRLRDFFNLPSELFLRT
ncbi:helix-turn-helix domain-containing protein [Niabella ginsengisoli]|uniref:Helix-turn-helix domain-containing protein n=1 Tax=Niabella ginsengisoli TaxID=522298 RepID=A0ABS9SFI3_9BACT|nr:helix-turn-helix domain-containing protein [Niabella ginsengisoli]MCH5597123.1 helix-turn-helix domain-containing protein [Niabella ginsengisoli]